MLPGRTYTFNVGAWVFGEAHGGVGTASIASALVLRVTLLHRFTASVEEDQHPDGVLHHARLRANPGSPTP
jgi:hypothetical protein